MVALEKESRKASGLAGHFASLLRWIFNSEKWKERRLFSLVGEILLTLVHFFAVE